MNKVFLRKATMEDIDLIFAWANDEDERRNSFNPEKIPYADHCRWYKNKMTSDDTFIFIMMQEDKPLGQCRIEIEGEEALISYFIDKNFRNQGLGKKILELLHEEVKSNFSKVRVLMAQVKEDNIPSRKVFESLGYSEIVYEAKGFRQYSLMV